MNRIETIERKVIGLLDQEARPLARQEYADLLSYLISNLEARQEAVQHELDDE